MDETAERMTALKKAYAEIILNSTKEAAARIMVSERKAFEYECDLSVTKEEALRLLMRLKMMMDDKINEAERKSLVRQKKIEELEAQLQEAEEIVSSLRAELSDAHAKVEKLYGNQQKSSGKPKQKSSGKPNLIEKIAVQMEITPAEDKVEEKGTFTGRSPELVAASTFKANSSMLNHCSSENRHIGANNGWGDHSCVGIADVASVMRTREPELYRNGCAQRIRAFERNLLDGHPPRQLNDLQDGDRLIKEEDHCAGHRVFPPRGATKKRTVSKKPGGVEGGKRIGGSTLRRSKKMCEVERRLAEVEEVTYVNDTAHSALVTKSFSKKRKRGLRSKRSEMSVLKFAPVEIREAFEAPNCTNSINCVTDSLKQLSLFYNDEDDDKSDSDTGPSVPRDISKPGTQSENESVKGCKSDEAAATKDDIEIADALVLMTQENGSRDASALRSLQAALKEHETSVNPDLKVSDASDSIAFQLPKERILKYTFQRKRKKQTLGSADIERQQQSPCKSKQVKKPNSVFDAPKSSYGAGIISR